MDNESKCGLLLISWTLITGVCLFAGVITYADEMTDRERERGDRYRARFLHEFKRKQK